MTRALERDLYYAALVRLLWRSVADQGSCAGDCEHDGAPLDICDAMRALGWGEHWDAEVFQQRATRAPA